MRIYIGGLYINKHANYVVRVTKVTGQVHRSMIDFDYVPGEASSSWLYVDTFVMNFRPVTKLELIMRKHDTEGY